MSDFIATIVGAIVLIAVIGSKRFSKSLGIDARPVIFRREALITVIVTLFIGFARENILSFLAHIFGLYGMRFVTCFGLITFGITSHLWKQSNQKTYGASEVLFGIVACIFSTFALTPDKPILGQWVSLGGSAYVIARGLNNIVEADKKLKDSTKQNAEAVRA